MITLKVRMFAMIRDLTGSGNVTITVADGCTVDRLCADLMSRYPGLERWRSHMRFAVNNEYVAGGHLLRDADEVAVIPPVSGG
jgi:molybdopterin converting factor subunit 1